MAKSLNKIQLIGRLGGDPEVKYTSKGTAVAKFTLATEDGYGENKKTSWHRIVVWKANAENAGKYLSKGSLVYLEGQLGYNEWEKDGVKRKDAEITAFNIVFLDSKPGGQKAGSAEDAGDLPF